MKCRFLGGKIWLGQKSLETLRNRQLSFFPVNTDFEQRLIVEALNADDVKEYSKDTVAAR